MTSVTSPGPGNISRELELLLYLAIRSAGPEREGGAAIDDERERTRELLAGQVDWDRLADLAMRHRVAPILYAALAANHANVPPPEFMSGLRLKSEAISRNNLLLTAELIALLRLFAASNIPALPLKGPVLADRLYGNLALRPFGDLDILIPPRHAGRAGELLRAAGYLPKPALSARQERAWLHFEHDRTYENRGTGGYLELHWHFFSRYIAFDLDRGDFWERLVPGDLRGTATLELPPAEQLIFLAAHGAKHHWISLGWIIDIARFVERHRDLDWSNVWQVARRTGTERIVLLALRLAAEYTGVFLPVPVRERIERDPAVTMLAGRVREAIALERGEDAIGTREVHGFYLASRERPADRLRYYWFWTLTPNARDRGLADLPRALYPLYHILRAVRMMGDVFR